MTKHITLVGARGYTGRIAKDLRPEALPVVRSASSVQSDELRGDIRDVAFAQELARASSVVLNFVGPFDEYARVLVRACAEAGTDYVDMRLGGPSRRPKRRRTRPAGPSVRWSTG